MITRNKKSTCLSGVNRFKSRRTSLNVNLSYVSSTSLLTEDETCPSSTSICGINIDTDVEQTVVERTELPVKRNLSLKRFAGSKQVSSTRNSGDQNNAIQIKPSFVRIVRLSTSTPVTSRNRKSSDDEVSEETFVPSENTKRSSVLEDIRFPLEGEIFSPSASIVVETSMDMTEVQGAAILNSTPQASEALNTFPCVDRIYDSLGVIEDTDISRYDIEEGVEAAIIPDSEQDSIDTIRTSLNVNTSLDSRFSSMQNNSIYDPKKGRDGRFENDILTENQLEGILSQPTSESSYGNVPANSLVVTTAVIEHRDSSNDTNYQEMIDQETTIDLEHPREAHPLHDASLRERTHSESDEFLNKKTNADNSSPTEASSSVNQDHRGPRLRISNDENEVIESITPGDLASKPIGRGKKKLFGLRRSEMVDLSPVATPIVPKSRVVLKKRVNRRNKTAKKIANKDDAAEKPVEIFSSDDDVVEVEVDLQPRKEKRVRKLKSKKIVIKKMPDRSMWKRMKENANTINESCDDISSALERTSLDDFELKNNVVRQKNRGIKPKIIIVATGLPLEQKLLVKNTVTTLGSAKVEKIVTRNTTHVVSKGTRTVNLLRGIVRGCWLVSFEWISKSCEAGEWVNPGEYEITGFSKAAQQNRKEKQLFGAAYVSELFLTCGLIHIKEETATPAPVLKELVRIAGGRVAAKPEEAKIIIGRGGFKEIWILDSISNGKIQPLEHYCKKKCLN